MPQIAKMSQKCSVSQLGNLCITGKCYFVIGSLSEKKNSTNFKVPRENDLYKLRNFPSGSDVVVCLYSQGKLDT